MNWIHTRAALTCAMILTAAAVASWSVEGRALEPAGSTLTTTDPGEAGEPRPLTRHGFMADFALLAGGGLANVAEGNASAGEFVTRGADVALRLGGFLTSGILLSNEFLVGVRRTTRPRSLSPEYPSLGNTTVGAFWPIRPSLTLYPAWPVSGLFFGAAAGVGVVSLPDFGRGSELAVSAGYSAEVGWEFSGDASRKFEVTLRVTGSVSHGDPIPGRPANGRAREILLGVRLPLRSPR